MIKQTEVKNPAECKPALVKLGAILKHAQHSDKLFQQVISGQEIVLKQYQPLFTMEAIGDMDADQFKSFLLFENNRHWIGLHRQGGRMCSDMKKLRGALKTILDENQGMSERWDAIAGKVSGLGRATISAILMVAYPHRYGVWNNTSEAALQELRLWPNFAHGTSLGRKYEVVNALLNRLASALGTDLWTLDALFWRVMRPAAEGGTVGIAEGDGMPTESDENKFGLEKHLHDFLFDNWGCTTLGKEWNLYAEDGDPQSAYEFPTGVGEIDLLARHKNGHRWLVIELKRGQTNDDTVGQVLRYIAWIRKNLASSKDKVEGLIIARSVGDSLRYAVSEVPQVSVMEYKVDFRLIPAKFVD